MSRFTSGWRTTIEPEELGYPVRYWWTEDDWSDVAWCESQSSAAAACSALGAARAQTDPDPDRELDQMRRDRADIDADELRTLQAAFSRRHAAVVELFVELLDEAVPLGELQRIVTSVRQSLDEPDRGLEQDGSVDATRGAARELEAQLAQPWAWRKRQDDEERKIIPFDRAFVVETRDALRTALKRLQVGATGDATAEADALTPLVLELDRALRPRGE